MKLTLEQTATRLGKTQRQVLYMIRQGKLSAEKIAGRWFIDATDLPVSERQQTVKERQQHHFQGVLEDALELDNTKRRYSVRDLKAFQITLPLYRAVCAAFAEDHPAARALRRTLEFLARGCHRFERKDKVDAYRAAREEASLAVCELALADSPEAGELLDGLEQDLMRALDGEHTHLVRLHP